jgi:carboxylesterase
VNICGPGNERALLLLHGFSSSPAVYRRLIPALTPAYDAIVCPALPGHGESIAAFTKVKASDWVTATEQVCEGLMSNFRHVDVLGLSLGGVLACNLSQRFALHHLYLLAPALALQLNVPLALKLASILRCLGCKRMRNRAGNLHSQGYCELAYRQVPITAVVEILTLINTYQFVPPSCPTDVFLGRFDKVVNLNFVETCFAHLPNTTIHWLEHSAHVLPLDGDVDSIVACVQGNR